jgi:hypothetical protein
MDIGTRGWKALAATLVIAAATFTTSSAAPGWDNYHDRGGALEFALQAKRALEENLMDFDSAKFPKPIYEGYQIIGGHKFYFARGMINAKNTYGAYTGPTDFVVYQRPDGIHVVVRDGGALAAAEFLVQIDEGPEVFDPGKDYRFYFASSSGAPR